MKPQLLFAFIFIIFAGGIASEDSSYVQNFHDYVLSHLNGDLSSTAVNEQRALVYVTIKNGTIKGFTARAINNRTVHTYQRIPFAKPPIGERRFKAPESQDGWDGILDGTRLTPACPQLLTGLVGPSEDCLYLNVYSSRNNASNGPLAPVMVYLFGGAFLLGEPSYYTGYNFLANDVVLVVPNYRLSVLGFLSTGDEVAPGNAGLKDQNLALRWVQENIQAFGGDPNRVTIFGESAGAASVIFHLLSPVSHGLFHAVIAQSATALVPWGVDPNPKRQAERLAKATGCPLDNSSAIVTCLRTLPTFTLTSTYVLNVTSEDLKSGDMSLAGTNAVVEPDIEGAFLTKDPYELLKEGNYPDVPVILGAVAEEGALFLGGLHYLTFGTKALVNSTLRHETWMREELLRVSFGTFKLNNYAGNAAVEESLALAFVPDENRLDFNTISDRMLDMCSMFMIKGPVLKTADILSEKLSSVYLYSFEYRTTNPRNSLWYYIFELFVPIMGGEIPPFNHGINHADDLIYQFNLPFTLDERDKEFSRMHCKLWTDFATHGTPTPTSSEYPVWPKYNWRERKYYVLQETPVVATDYAQQWIQ